jgi:hypothetical protein
MATTDPVSVVIEIIDQFSDDLAKLQAELDKIDGTSLDVDLDIDSAAEVAKTKAELDALDREQIDVETNVKNDPGKSILDSITDATDRADLAIRQMNQRYEDMFDGQPADMGLFVSRDERPTPAFDVNIDPVVDALDTVDERIETTLDKSFEVDPFEGRGLTIPEMDLRQMESVGTSLDEIDDAFDLFDRRQKKSGSRNGLLGKMTGPLSMMVGGIGGSLSTAVGGALAEMGKIDLPDLDFSDLTLRGLGGRLKKSLPSLRTYTRMIAALIPVLVTLAGAALGAAAAIGSLVGAGALLVGLGALGLGPDATSSIRRFRQEINQLGASLAETFRPVSLAFAPVLLNLLDEVEVSAGRLVQPLMGLQAFGDLLSDGISGTVDWFGQLVAAAVGLERPIERVSALIGNDLGSYMIDLFRWAVEEIDANYELYRALAATLANLIGIFYSLSKIISRVVAAFQPLFAGLEYIFALLDNKIVAGILAFVSGMVLAISAGSALAGVMAAVAGILTGLSFAGIVAGLAAVTSAAWQAFVALMAANAQLAALTLGASVLVGAGAAAAVLSSGGAQQAATGRGTSPPPAPAPSRNNSTTINLYGSVGSRDMNKLIDTIDTRIATRNRITNNTVRSP